MSTNKKWTEEKIERCIDILSEHQEVGHAGHAEGIAESPSGAIAEINEESIGTITSSALRKALKRYGYESPSHYLGSDEEKRDGAEFTEEEKQEYEASYSNQWGINREEKKYEFIFECSKLELTFDQVEIATLLFSKHPPGKDKTGDEVALYLKRHHNIEWIDGDFIRWMFRSFNYAKSMHPSCPHQQFEDDEEMVKYMMRKSEIINDEIRTHETLKSYQEKLEEKNEEIEEFEELLGMKESLPRHIDNLGSFDMKPNEGLLLGFFADLHAGKKEEEREHGKTPNIYNREEFFRRVQVVSSLIQQVLEQLGDRVKKQYLLALGDDFESLMMNIRDGMHQRMYGTPQETWTDVVRAYKTFISKMSDGPGPLESYFIGGNHDRTEHAKVTRTERVLNYILMERLQSEFQNEEDIDINQGRAVTSLMLENNVNAIFKHGHLKSIPKTKWNQFKDVHGYKEADRFLTAQGHFHSLEIKDYCEGMHIQVPSFVGPDVYSTDFLHESNEARFMMVFSTPYEDQILGPWNIQKRAAALR